MEEKALTTIAQEYYDLVCEFCDYLENTVITADCIDDLMTYLMTLYMEGIRLPHVEPDSVEECEKPLREQFLRIECEDGYYMMFDPFTDEEPVCGTLYDDFFDIYSDLRRAAFEYEAGHINNAIWSWSFGLYNHWGSHLINALKVLHALRKR